MKRNVRKAARDYLSRGWYSVVVLPQSKEPFSDDWPKIRIEQSAIQTAFSVKDNIGLVLGEPSGWLVDVDLDCPEAIELADQHLPPTPAVTGRRNRPKSHRWYIAQGAVTTQYTDPVIGKKIVELRSTGGQTVVGPSIHPDGDLYEPLEGEPAVVPAPMLAACVKSLAEAVYQFRYPTPPPPPPSKPSLPPADIDVERRAIAYLDAMPPAVSGCGGHSQTFAAATALVHGFALDPDRALTLLTTHYNPRCDPPWSDKELQHKINQAASKPHDRPYGWLLEDPLTTPSNDSDVDLSALLNRSSVVVQEYDDEPEAEPALIQEDPGILPDRLLRIPGFVSEVMDHCLETAPYPNVVMAFCGALSLLAMLAGRRVRDPGDNRTNLYLLGLAHSAAGKDWPRKLNVRILQSVGLADCTGERFASGEGIQDALNITPSMLFQTDEIDGLLQSISRSSDARFEQIMTTLLTMYSSANSVYPMRRKASKESPGVINQPNLVIFGTAIPNHYYEALSQRMLTNGLFARMLIFECGKRGPGQEPKIRDIPKSILETTAWWEDFRPGAGNLVDWNPVPAIVPQNEAAAGLLIEARINAETQYSKAEEKNDSVGTTVWGRVSEQMRKLALLHAVSRCCRNPVIDAESARWAIDVVDHQTRRMLYMASDHVSQNSFDAMAKAVIRQLKHWHARKGDVPMPEWELTRRLPWKPSDHREVIALLESQRLISRAHSMSKTRQGYVYRLLAG